MRTWLLVTSLAMSLPLAACGDDTGGAGGGGTGGGGTGGSDATTSTTGDTTTTTTTTGTTTSTGGGAAVQQIVCAGVDATDIVTEGFAFSPTAVTIGVGDVIRFTPESSAHNISGDGWSSEFGVETCFQFLEAGDYDFVCDAHSTMTGTVTVE